MASTIDKTTQPAPQVTAKPPSPFAGLPNRPVFVGGCPRSGTTMLRLMLNSHPELAMPRETRFLIQAWERRAVFGDLSDPQNRRRVARWLARRRKTRLQRLGIGLEELLPALETAPPTIGSLLRIPFALYAERQAKDRWGDKRPTYAQHLDALFAMFPDLQFVNVVRDPRATVASVRKLGWYGGDVVGGIDLWQRSIDAVDRWRGRLAADQLLEIQYEQLVHDPGGSLERIAAFLGLDVEGVGAMLRFHQHSDVPKEGAFHPRVSRPVTTERVRTWAETLGREEIAFVEHVLAGTMRRYGYEPEEVATAAPHELLRRYRRLRRRQLRKRVLRRTRETKLRLTYRYSVVAEPGAGPGSRAAPA